MTERGEILRIKRGLYSSPGAEISSNRSVLEAITQVPGGVLCLLTVLRHHEIGTQSPHEVWIARLRGSWSPIVRGVRTRIVVFSGQAFSEGIEHVRIEGIQVSMYSIAKTIADLFKYRNKVGIDVATEALRETLRKRLAQPSEIMKYARICRVANVIRPYLESLL